MIQRLFIDTNVMMDFLDQRPKFFSAAAKLIVMADKKKVMLVLTPTSFVNSDYLLGKNESRNIVRDKLKKFKVISEICILDESIIEKALHSSFSDFEDAVQYYGALDSHCDIIITRNVKDFKESAIPVMTPNEYLSSLKRP
jgi:predicted nucleic acid-binding protein